MNGQTRHTQKTERRGVRYDLIHYLPDNWRNSVAEWKDSVSKCLYWLRSVASGIWLSWQPQPQSSSYKEHKIYLDAEKYRKDVFTPNPTRDYKWAIEYAKESYQRLEKTFQYLDEKADAIIKYLGGGTAVVTLAALTTVNRYSAWLPILLLPSLVCALRAIALALSVRQPTNHPSLPRVTTAIDYVHAYHEAEETMLGFWHECCEGLDLVNGEKAKRVDAAGLYYYRALFCLLIPLIVWPIWNVVAPPKTTPTRVEIINDDRPR